MVDAEEFANSLVENWGGEFLYFDCEACHSSFLITKDHQNILCPTCFKSELAILNSLDPDFSEIRIPEPEFITPFQVGNVQISAAWKKFFGGFWFRPTDLQEENLQNRLTAVYLPVWLVDANVNAEWNVEAGFNYQVVSHKDRFDDRRGGWQTQEVQETRLRWESRIGKLQRRYHNISAPAMENNSFYSQRLGSYSNSSRLVYENLPMLPSSEGLIQCVRLPDRMQNDAWSDALPRFEEEAISECQIAIGANALRSFRWAPEFSNINWTLNLLPILTTYYRDDEGEVHVLLLNGQNGNISGVRKASKIRARNVSLWVFLAGFVVFMISLLISILGGILSPFLIPLGFIGLGTAGLIGLMAMLPLIIVWLMNRKL